LSRSEQEVIASGFQALAGWLATWIVAGMLTETTSGSSYDSVIPNLWFRKFMVRVENAECVPFARVGIPLLLYT
jgi:hypothetical protein